MMRHPRRLPHGSTLFVALVVLAALSFFAAYTLQRISPGLHAAYQNAAWQEARIAAESGIDAAIGDLVRYETGSASGAWEGWKQETPEGPRDVPPNLLKGVLTTTSSLLQNLTAVLGLGGLLGGGSGSATPPPNPDPIYLDNIRVSAANGVPSEVDVRLWALRPTGPGTKPIIRIRSMATCALPPSANRSPFRLDVPLRRFNLRERRARVRADDVGQPSTIPLPNVTRTVEVLLEPITPFELALWTNGTISLPATGHWVADSYDSSDPEHSNPNGTYPGADSPKTLASGHLASNLLRPAEAPYGTLIAANGADVRGWIATNGGDNPDTPECENVSGAVPHHSDRVRDDFQREMLPVTPPAVAHPLPPPPPGTPFIPGTATIPSFYRCPGDLGAFTVAAPDSGTTAAIVIFVDGNLNVTDRPIIIPQNVVAELYVRGDIDFHDNAVNSGPWNSNRPAQLLIFGQGSQNESRTIKASGDARICAAFYGPGYDAQIDGSVHWYGSIAAKSYAAPWGGDGGIHYDAALASIGPPVSFRIVRYIDDVRQ